MSMPAWGANYEIITRLTAVAGDPKGNYIDNDFNEYFDKLVDGNVNTKWCCSGFNDGYIEFSHDEALYIHGYILTTANDNKEWTERNPKAWTLYGKNPVSDTWEVLHDVKDDQVLQDVNYTAFTFKLPVPTQSKYSYFRLELHSTKGANVMQLSELQLLGSKTFQACPHIKTIRHAAQPATCISYATIEYWECMDCRTKFSDAATSNVIQNTVVSETYGAHDQLVHHEAINATCTHTGQSEYWSCNRCNKNFSDAKATSEIEDLASIVLAPIEPFSIVDDRTTSTSDCGYCAFYNYGGSQNLYLASEIGYGMTIKSISLYCNSSNSNHLREIEIWMGETSDKELNPQKPFSDQQLTRVFKGQKTIGISEGWEELVLDTEYAYSGEKNLVIAIYTPTGSFKEIKYGAGSSYNKNAIYRQLDDDSSYADITYTEKYTSGSRPILRINKPGHPDEKSTNINGIITCSLCGAREEPASIMTLALDDIHSYERATSATVNNLSYARSFDTANQWEPLYLPFSFVYTEEDAELYDLAEINTYGVSSDTNHDGIIDVNDQKVLLVQLIEPGSILNANTPYLIRAKKEDNIIFVFTSNDGKLHKAESGTVTCGTFKDQLAFVGNNSFKSNLATDGCYIMSNGKLVKATSDDMTLNPFTWYMQSSSKNIADAITIAERGAHKHIDKNEDGQCDYCEYLYPLDEVTADNYEELGLSEDYIGYYAISKYWQLCNAMDMIEEREYYDTWTNLKFVLTNDIVANGNILDPKGNLLPNLKEWEGGELKNYCVLDGNGHSIKGLVYTKSVDGKIALFDKIDNNAIICNLGIEDSYFSYEYGGYGDHNISTFAAEVKEGTIINCWSNATIVAKTGANGNIGGIVASSIKGSISNCTFNGSIKVHDSDNANVGGIVGYHENSSYRDSLTCCHFAGSIISTNVLDFSIGGIGGLCGGVVISQCFSDGSFTTSNSLGGYVGGIVGMASIEHENCGSYVTLPVIISDCANAMNLAASGEVYAGGIVGMSGAEYDPNYTTGVKVVNSINVGSITNKGEKDSATECYGSGEICIVDFYYLSDENTDVFKSGELANILNKFDEKEISNNSVDNGYYNSEAGNTAIKKTKWGQNIGIDPYPVPDPDNHQNVYAVENNGLKYVNPSTKSFAVEDGYDFVNTDEVEFAAETATYSRSMANAWGTLCLPFSIDYDPTNTNYNLYTLKEIAQAEDGESDVLMFEELEEGTIAGGTPLVVKVLSGNTLSIIEKDAKFVTDTIEVGCGEDARNWKAKGTLTNHKEIQGGQLNPDDAEGDIYYIAQNKFWYANMAFDMAAFRSWFEAPTKTPAGSATRRFTIGEWDGSATGIKVIESKDGKNVKMIFNLAGQRQNAMQKGLNIVNTEKVLVK